MALLSYCALVLLVRISMNGFSPRRNRHHLAPKKKTLFKDIFVPASPTSLLSPKQQNRDL